MSNKIQAGAKMPEFDLPKVGGGSVRIGGKGRWQMVVVYRGKHCPLCKRYLATLDGLTDDLEKVNTEVVAISGDPAEKAVPDVEEMGISIPVGYGLDTERMRELGLYVSTPRPQETDREFAEPGLFVVNPSGDVQIVDVSNAPFSRPDIAGVIRGIGLIQERDYPIRGTAN